MGWNYRLFKHDDKTVWYGIHEVFYKTNESNEFNENEIDCISSDPIDPHGATKEDIEEDLDNMRAALDKPVLDYNQMLEKLKNG
ncbi:MAG: hypothetical protein HOG49_14205 [Candidatus Scalindua sp.]|jgi:hypothetical protein|nr:hypothetical protein [Candidatus Scalindua sp.]